MNLPLALLILGAGSLLVRAGIANPPGGAFGEIGRTLRGQSATGPASSGAGVLAALFSPTTAPTGATVSSASQPSQAASAVGGAVVAEARRQIGVPYLWGGNTPQEGFDCSGFTRWCYGHAGVSLPRLASAQQATGQNVPGLAATAPGDLVFYGVPAHHVGIVIGGGRMIAAPHTGALVREQAIYDGWANIRRYSPSGVVSA